MLRGDTGQLARAAVSVTVPSYAARQTGLRSAAHTAPGPLSSEQVIAFFVSKGLTRGQAAGIAGNLQQESSLNPSDPGGYLAQWGGDRLKGLEAFAKAHGHATAAGNGPIQLEYIWHELQTSEKGTLTKLIQSELPQEAAKVFSELFERPGNPQLPNREKYAREAYEHKLPAGAPSLQQYEKETSEARKGEKETEPTGWVAALEGIAKTFKRLGEGSTWIRTGKVIVGVIIIGFAVYLLVRAVSAPAASAVTAPLRVARRGRPTPRIRPRRAAPAPAPKVSVNPSKVVNIPPNAGNAPGQ